MIDKKLALDIGERVLSTFLQAFAGVWVASFVPGTEIDLKACLVAATSAGALSVAKGYLAGKFVSRKDSASMAPGV